MDQVFRLRATRLLGLRSWENLVKGGMLESRLDFSSQRFEDRENSCKEAVPGKELIDAFFLKVVPLCIGGVDLSERFDP